MAFADTYMSRDVCRDVGRCSEKQVWPFESSYIIFRPENNINSHNDEERLRSPTQHTIFLRRTNKQSRM